MRQIRIERKAPIRQHRDRDAVLPLDPRDPDILRAKLLLRRRTSNHPDGVGSRGSSEAWRGRLKRPTAARA
jgi:hypothetical protein